MKVDRLANSKNDEFYTPPYAVKPLLKYIPKGSRIWCPFDTKDSWFVKVLSANGYIVINTHISTGNDFFYNYVPPGTEYIVSNPPYSRKGEVLERLFMLNKPFAMLVGIAGLFESDHRFNLFKSNKFEIMYLNRRVSFLNTAYEKVPSINPPFSSGYICSNVLPQQIVFEEINKKDLSTTHPNTAEET